MAASLLPPLARGVRARPRRLLRSRPRRLGDHAAGTDPLGDCQLDRHHRHLGGILEPARGRDEMKRLLIIAALASLTGGCGRNAADPNQYGGDPQLPEQQRALVPSMKIADPPPWGNARPNVPDGFTITAIATGLGIARQTLVLPNGDILVAEGRGG